MGFARRAERQRARRENKQEPVCVPLDQKRFERAFARACRDSADDTIPIPSIAPIMVEGVGGISFQSDTLEKRAMIRFFHALKLAFPNNEEYMSAATRASFLTYVSANPGEDYSVFYRGDIGSENQEISNAFIEAVGSCRFLKNATAPASPEEVHELVCIILEKA
jgi:hypothetical protein